MAQEQKPELYFATRELWRSWLLENHAAHTGVYLVLYRVSSEVPCLRWEEAVQEAICFGWIDSTVKRLDEQRRRQWFTPRRPKSPWSQVNKTYVEQLVREGLMHPSGWSKIEQAQQDGSWNLLDDVENLRVPEDLERAFAENPVAFTNYQNFSKTYRKGYLYWLNHAKREQTRQQRIQEIIRLCEANQKSRADGELPKSKD